MQPLEELLRGTAQLARVEGLEAVLLALVLAFALGQLIAWVYVHTHAGISFSRSFTQSLVLITMVVALVMLVIGDNIVTAFGLIGALAIVRFRNVLKDTRDLVFVFLCLVVGMAVGSQRHGVAVLGTLALLATCLYLQLTAFGTRTRLDGHLTLWVEAAGAEGLDDVLYRFCRHVARLSVRGGGPNGESEHVFAVRLRDRSRHGELVEELRAVPGVGDVALVLQDELAEI